MKYFMNYLSGFRLLFLRVSCIFVQAKENPNMKLKRICFDEDKFRESIVYIAQETESDHSFGAIKMAKALWLADFWAYERLGKPITGATYQRIEHGPAAREYRPVVGNMLSEGVIRESVGTDHNENVKKLTVPKKQEIQLLSGDEMAVLVEAIRYLQPMTTSEIEKMAHEWKGMDYVADKMAIPYGVILYPETPIQPNEHIKELARRVAEKIDSGAYRCHSQGQSVGQ
jgi:hypothetical protein